MLSTGKVLNKWQPLFIYFFLVLCLSRGTACPCLSHVSLEPGHLTRRPNCPFTSLFGHEQGLGRRETTFWRKCSGALSVAATDAFVLITVFSDYILSLHTPVLFLKKNLPGKHRPLRKRSEVPLFLFLTFHPSFISSTSVY